MNLPGRNDPCTCGSGRKSKRCYGASSREEREEIDITDDDRTSAYDVLERLARAPRFAKDLEVAAHRISERPLAGRLDDIDDEVNVGRFLDWLSLDVLLHTGRTLAAKALASRSGELTPGARRLIADLERSPLRMVQVRTLFFGGVAFLAADLLEPATTYRVHAGWFDVERHDVLIARLVRRGSWFEVEGDPAVFPPFEKRKLLGTLRRARRELARGASSPAATRIVQGAILLRLMRTLAEDDMVLETIEGDPVRSYVVFDRIETGATRPAAVESVQ